MNLSTINDYELITNQEYCNLVSPEFMGQTRLDDNNMYYMCWKSEGKLYKTHNKL